MFGINTTEILVILGVMVLLFGGKKIPELARGLGQGIKEFRFGIKEIQEPLKEAKNEIKNSVDEVTAGINREAREIKQTINGKEIW